MVSTEQFQQIYDQLRRLTVSDPRQARLFLCQLLDANDPRLDELFARLSAPGEGRIRQLVANAVHTRKDLERFVPHLLRWQEIETDQFAKGAIDSALAGIDLSAYQSQAASDLPDLVDTYRYVAEKLCHRVRNSLGAPRKYIMQLQRRLEAVSDDALRQELTTTLAKLRDSFRQLGRIVEFNDNDDYFRWRPIQISDWIATMNDAYAAKYEPITLSLTFSPERRPHQIRANDFLLHTIFWNLWRNAQEAVSNQCKIHIEVSTVADCVELLISDNGPGFKPEETEIAFELPFSTKDRNRGRGLLEVKDAVERLSGKVELTEVQSGEYRLKLSFPLEIP